MDIRPNQDAYKPSEPGKTAVSTNHSKFRTGVVTTSSAAIQYPPFIREKLSKLSKMYGLPIDLGEFSLDKATPENLKAMRKVTQMLTAQSKLLPEFLKFAKAVMDGDMKVSEYHKNVTKMAIKHQESIDKDTADIFLMMARYGSKSSKLETRVNTRNALIEKRTEAYERHYENSVFGEESRIIDAEYQIAASNQKSLSASKTKRIQFNADTKQKMQAYIDSAYED